jgi:hypothetical protein
MTRILAIATLVLSAVPPLLAQALSSSDDVAKMLHALFDEDWQWRLEQNPEAATLLGDNRFNDRLTDFSPQRSSAARLTIARCSGVSSKSIGRASRGRMQSRTISFCSKRR